MLFNGNISDDEYILAIALLEVEGGGDGVERLEGEREVATVNFGSIFRPDGVCFGLGRDILVERYAVGCCQFVFLTVGSEVRIMGNVEPEPFLCIISETDGCAIGN